MISVEEGLLRFEFPDSWRVVKYDDPGSFYGRKMERLDGTKAVDILALSPDPVLYFVEVKDFRGYRIENKPRRTGLLWNEVAQKVRDTLAGIVGAYRDPNWTDDFAPFVRQLRRPAASIRIVAWIEDDGHANDLKRRAATDTSMLKRKVRWLTPRAIVAGSYTGADALSGVGVVNLRQKAS